MGLRQKLLLAGFGLASFLATETASADPSVASATARRPPIQVDRFGRTVVDVCPDYGTGRRCFAHRILRPGEPSPVAYGGPGGCSGSAGTGDPAPPKGALAPDAILSYYDIPPTASAKGAIVALVDLPSVNALADVNAYRNTYGIDPLSPCPVNAAGVPTPAGVACFARVGSDGTVNTASTTDCPGWVSETSLDMDMVSAACPDCSIVVVEAADSFGNDLDMMVPVASGIVGAAAVSNSWGGPEYPGDDDTYYDATSSLILASAGDYGYLNELTGSSAPTFPASSPNVLGVGGTTLYYTESLEVVWDDAASSGGGATTSGCSTEFPMPSYQSSSPFHFGSCTMRASTDIAAVADFFDGSGGGVSTYVTDAGGWVALTGTSASSPLVAAIMVRLGLGGADRHALFYENGGAFNDVTTGNDDPDSICGGTVMCTAGRFWDGPTGLGTPNGTRLMALAAGTLEPEPDAGPDAAPEASTSEAGTDAMLVDSATDAPEAGSPMLPMGAACTTTSQCVEPNQCKAPHEGAAKVCAPSCAVESCPSNTACISGYCFADTTKNDTDAGGKAAASGSSGCSCSQAGSRQQNDAAWACIALGCLIVRRSKRRPGSRPSLPRFARRFTPKSAPADIA